MQPRLTSAHGPHIQHESTNFCNIHRHYKECVRASCMTRPDEQCWFSYREQHLYHSREKRHCRSAALLCTPCRPRSRAHMHASFPYLVNQPSIRKVKHLLWAGPSAECWGHISALDKSRGRDRHHFKASWWQRFLSFLSL